MGLPSQRLARDRERGPGAPVWRAACFFRGHTHTVPKQEEVPVVDCSEARNRNVPSVRVCKWGSLCQERRKGRTREREREAVPPFLPPPPNPTSREPHRAFTDREEGEESLRRKLSTILGLFLPSAGESQLALFCAQAVSRSVLSKGWCIKRKQMGAIPSAKSLWTET